jgi:UDP-N-acetylglucosamine acyltransferase
VSSTHAASRPIEDIPTPTPRIDPTAYVHPTAELGDGVVIGRHAYVGPGCALGDGTVLMHNATVLAHTRMGSRNVVHPGAVLGGDPQDRAFNPDVPGALHVGDDNIFREGVTVSRSTGEDRPTRIGSRCMFMACSHAGHNALVGDGVVLVNSAVLAGWTEVGNGATLSGFCGVHQFCRVGEGVMFRGRAIATKHVPPFVVMTEFNQVVGLNRVGIRRNPNLTASERLDIRLAFRAFYGAERDRAVRPLRERLDALDALTLAPAAERFRAFIHECLNAEGRFRRGVAGRRPKRGVSASDEDPGE